MAAPWSKSAGRSSDISAVEPFKDDLLKREHLTLDHLYNCDETGLCYRMLPDKTLAARPEKDAFVYFVYRCQSISTKFRTVYL